VNKLERRGRWLLHVYPAAYRRERGEEMIGTLLEATPEGQAWPRVRDAFALIAGGLKARAAQNRQRSMSANLRIAVMAGITIYLSLGIGEYLTGVAVAGFGALSWPAAAIILLMVTTVVLAWCTFRAAALTSALFAAAGFVYLMHAFLAGPPLIQLLCLPAIAALAPASGHLSWRWLGLLGLIGVAPAVLEFAARHGWLNVSVPHTPGAVLLGVAGVGVLWMSIDARLAVAVLTFAELWGLGRAMVGIRWGSLVTVLPPMLIVAAIATPAIWLLRRQSARPVRTA
jgi:hypothetical protein